MYIIAEKFKGLFNFVVTEVNELLIKDEIANNGSENPIKKKKDKRKHSTVSLGKKNKSNVIEKLLPGQTRYTIAAKYLNENKSDMIIDEAFEFVSSAAFEHHFITEIHLQTDARKRKVKQAKKLKREHDQLQVLTGLSDLMVNPEQFDFNDMGLNDVQATYIIKGVQSLHQVNISYGVILEHCRKQQKQIGVLEYQLKEKQTEIDELKEVINAMHAENTVADTPDQQ